MATDVPDNVPNNIDNSNSIRIDPRIGDAYGEVLNDWSSFAYVFVDKFGEKRAIPSVLKVDLCKEENGKNHYTSKFFINREVNNHLVIRRGQPFRIKVNFDVDFNSETDIMRLRLQIGKNPMISQNTEVLIPVKTGWSNLQKVWNATLTPKRGREINVAITSPPDCIVGIWSIEFQIIRLEDIHEDYFGEPIMNRYQSNTIYILFNPWCSDDLVYMQEEDWKKEYVLNDVGKIWRGAASSFRPCVWNYGQYENDILHACMVLLDWSNLRYRQRSSPVHVSRTVSAMVNANDDRGILVGNWSGDYKDGTPPTDWQGSVQILQKWFNEDGRPVCYGQCWVFSGVTTTVMRALGIPCRSVTNFQSAHDTDASITIDSHFNEKGKLVKEMTYDSVWNFHVWNDCWMMRPDLPKGYGGWQAIDATPQELSEGRFRTGPASLVAIRRGEVGYQYDTPFVFAEVNADRVYWLYKNKDEPLKFIDLDSKAIGKFISTKKPGPLLRGNLDRFDITTEYKQQESSEEERISVMNAVYQGQSSARSIYQKQEVADVECELEVKDEIKLGQDFHIRVKIVNKSNEVRTIKTSFRVDTMLYTGVIVKKIAKDYSTVVLNPLEDKIASIQVKAEQYIDRLQDQGSMLMSAMLHVQETGQTYHAQDDFRIAFPEISIWVQGKMCVNRPSKVYASFLNPLNKILRYPKFIFEGPGVEMPTEIRIPNVGRHQKAEATWEVTPKEEGTHTILVSFTSFELRDIDGSTEIQIYPK